MKIQLISNSIFQIFLVAILAVSCYAAPQIGGGSTTSTASLNASQTASLVATTQQQIAALQALAAAFSTVATNNQGTALGQAATSLTSATQSVIALFNNVLTTATSSTPDYTLLTNQIGAAITSFVGLSTAAAANVSSTSPSVLQQANATLGPAVQNAATAFQNFLGVVQSIAPSLASLPNASNLTGPLALATALLPTLLAIATGLVGVVLGTVGTVLGALTGVLGGKCYSMFKF